jgi:putative ATP-dependent endonuclease of OLD family
VHFDAYAKLFSAEALPKKCAIIADGDLKPSDADPTIEGEDDLPDPADLTALESDYVRVFACATTLERAITLRGTLEMLARAADDVGAPTVAARLRDGITALAATQDGSERRRILAPLRESVLSTAKRFGKARFAQIASRHVDVATNIPKYIADAAEWLITP